MKIIKTVLKTFAILWTSAFVMMLMFLIMAIFFANNMSTMSP